MLNPQEKSPVNPVQFDDLIVVKRADLDRLLAAVNDLWDSASDEGCEAPYFVGDMTHMQATRNVVGDLSGSLSLAQALRRVDSCEDADPILVVMPKGLDDTGLIALMDAAIDRANQETDFGADGRYFEMLQAQLAGSGVAIDSGIELLSSKPWDTDQMSVPFEDMVSVQMRSSLVELDELDPVCTLEDGSSIAINPDGPFLAICQKLDVVYPRSDKYGVPDMATEDGARVYVKQVLGLLVDPEFELQVHDSGDSTPLSFTMSALIHKECLMPVQAEREGERS